MQQLMFGKLPVGVHLQRIRQSPQYKNGVFNNISFTPDGTDGANTWV